MSMCANQIVIANAMLSEHCSGCRDRWMTDATYLTSIDELVGAVNVSHEIVQISGKVHLVFYL